MRLRGNWLLALVLLHQVTSYSLDYYDCTKAKTIRKYARDTMCTPSPITATETTTYKILQLAKVTRFSGYSCRMEVSTFTFKCGAWSHLKLASIPEIEHISTISEEWCQSMVNHRKFKADKTGQTFPLEIGQVNIIPIIELGSLVEKDDHLVCTGETYHSGNTMHTNVVLLREYKVLLTKEEFATDGTSTEVTTAKVSLPCPPSSNGCVTGDGTYIWTESTNKCNLQVIKEFKPTIVLSTYLLDTSQHILINNTGSTRLVNCDGELLKTNYPSIFLASLEQHVKLPDLDPGELELSVESRVARDFMTYQEEVRNRAATDDMTSLMCQQQQQGGSGVPTRIKGNMFSLTKGDLYLVYFCELNTAKIRDTSICYDMIPIETDPPSFVDPSNRLMVKVAAPIICNRLFPLSVRSNQGWLELVPHPRLVSAPAAGEPKDLHTSSHEDFSQSVLYTDQEIVDWEKLLDYPSYHLAKLKDLTWGTCVHEGACQTGSSEGVSRYDLDHLLRSEEGSLWNPLMKLTAFVHNNGDWLALLVILWAIFRFIVDTTMITLTLLQEGPQAAAALIMHLYLSTAVSYKKIKRKNRKLKKHLEEMELEPLT